MLGSQIRKARLTSSRLPIVRRGRPNRCRTYHFPGRVQRGRWTLADSVVEVLIPATRRLYLREDPTVGQVLRGLTPIGPKILVACPSRRLMRRCPRTNVLA